MHLTPSFLEQYRNRPDPFKSLLSRSVYKSKYQRKEDLGWWDTIRRVVEGNCSRSSLVSQEEAEYLYDTFYNQYCLPAGRGLFTGGVDIPDDAGYNCAHKTIRKVEDFGWVLRHSMAGCGVGVSYFAIDELPIVSIRVNKVTVICDDSHPDKHEFTCDEVTVGVRHVVEDTREGWAAAYTAALRAGIGGTDLCIDVTKVRPRGSNLKRFGGTASGPEPLVRGIRLASNIINNRRGSRLRVIDCSDLVNISGIITKAGNIRRTALINIGSLYDQEFLDAKLTTEDVLGFRHTSNNSVGLYSQADVDYLVANPGIIADRVRQKAEPGFVNVFRMREDNDPDVEGVQPCGELPLEDSGFCCLSWIMLQNIRNLSHSEKRKRIKAVTRFLVRERLRSHSCEVAEAVRKKNFRIGLGVSGCASNMDFEYGHYYDCVRSDANEHADELDVNDPIKVSTVPPGGTVPLVAGSDEPGMHSAYAPRYIRRTRIAIHEPMAGALIEAGVPWEYDVYDSTNKTLCFEFPCKSDSTVFAKYESARSQLERQLKLQREWSDNSVSATITFDETDDLEELISEFVPQLKSTSFQPRSGGGYEQLPYEEITNEEYERRYSEINHDHALVWGDDSLQVGECAGGACPSRLDALLTRRYGCL
jgi:ribonucleoside-triphosphate reductase (thioredoxin)